MDPAIDIVVTYVDSSVKEWQEERELWEKKESIQKRILTSKQNTGECRYRNWDTLAFWFRGVEQNLPWINKVFLIVEDEKHIPNWLNINHPKLKVVFHRDYIPLELLPTFNSNTIEMFLYKIPELADLYLLANDDIFVINPISKKLFYNDGIVKNKTITWYSRQSGEFNRTLENNHKLLVENGIISCRYQFISSHLIELHQKSLEEQFITKNYTKIYKSLEYSHFRHTINYTNWMLSDLLKAAKTTKDNPSIYKNSYFVNIRNNSFDTQKAKKSEMLCLNDCPETNFKVAKENTLKFFEEIFPEKSSFEK